MCLGLLNKTRIMLIYVFDALIRIISVLLHKCLIAYYRNRYRGRRGEPYPQQNKESNLLLASLIRYRIITAYTKKAVCDWL